MLRALLVVVLVTVLGVAAPTACELYRGAFLASAYRGHPCGGYPPSECRGVRGSERPESLQALIDTLDRAGPPVAPDAGSP